MPDVPFDCNYVSRLYKNVRAESVPPFTRVGWLSGLHPSYSSTRRCFDIKLQHCLLTYYDVIAICANGYTQVGRCVLGQSTVVGTIDFTDLVTDCVEITLSRAEAAFVFSQTNFAFGMPVPVGVVKYFYMAPFLRLSDDINYENCPILEGHFKKGSPIVRASKGGAVPTA